MRLDLIPHPDARPEAILAVEVELSVDPGNDMLIRYVVTGSGLLLPEWQSPGRADDLWETTCFELFVGSADAVDYVEFNFSPSTLWAAYRFDGYRRGMRDADVAPPRIETRIGPDLFELSVELALAGEGRLGLSAVIEEKSGAKSWWALAHPPGDPDFHHADCFALELPAAEAP